MLDRSFRDRTMSLRSLTVPALVIHGADDPLVDVSGGEATARAIPGAERVVFEGMGHDLPRALWPDMTARIAALVAHGEAAPPRRIRGHEQTGSRVAPTT
jgi:pimeloyl-ACP methyl ester carboxylesterase